MTREPPQCGQPQSLLAERLDAAAADAEIPDRRLALSWRDTCGSDTRAPTATAAPTFVEAEALLRRASALGSIGRYLGRRGAALRRAVASVASCSSVSRRCRLDIARQQGCDGLGCHCFRGIRGPLWAAMRSTSALIQDSIGASLLLQGLTSWLLSTFMPSRAAFPWDGRRLCRGL
jgi:hypothetical protein